MELDYLLPSYQKLYSALESLERFSINQDLFDNIACIDRFLSEYRNITFVLQKSLAHTDYVYAYERLRDRYLKNSECSWLVNKRNEVLKEHPFALVKKFILNIYLQQTSCIYSSESYTIDDEIEYTSLINSVKNIVESIPSIEVYFSTEFIYNENGSNLNLFSTIESGINSIFSLLIELDKEIGVGSSNARMSVIRKIESLNFYKILKYDWFIEDYVYYKKNNLFEKGQRLNCIPPSINAIHYTTFCKTFYVSNNGDFIRETFEAFKQMNILCFSKQMMIAPTFLILKEDGSISILIYDATVKTTTYRKINEIALDIKANANIVAVFHVCTMLCYNNLDVLNIDYINRGSEKHTEELSFSIVTRDSFEQYFINCDTIIKNLEDCLSSTLIKIDMRDAITSMRPISDAFLQQQEKHI